MKPGFLSLADRLAFLPVRLPHVAAFWRYEASGKTLKEAHAKAAKKKLALERGEAGASGNMTVKRWAEEWLETYKEFAVGEVQYKNYQVYIKVIISSIGPKKLKDVKDVDLQKILNGRVGHSKSDLSKLRMTIKSMFKRARISRLIPYDPAEELELPAAKDGTHRSITADERVRILALAETHHAGLWIKTMLYCGLRPGETRALDWDCVKIRLKIFLRKKQGQRYNALLAFFIFLRYYEICIHDIMLIFIIEDYLFPISFFPIGFP